MVKNAKPRIACVERHGTFTELIVGLTTVSRKAMAKRFPNIPLILSSGNRG